jgi:putative peptidoglycan lipid II flippase
MPQSFYISVVVAMQLIAAFATQLIIVRLVGIGPDTDAYIAAQAVPSVLSAIIISALQSVWLPRISVLSHNLTAWRIEQAMAQGQAFIMGAGLLCIVWFSTTWWQPILFSGLSTAQLHSASLFAGPMFIAAALSTQSALLTIALHTRDRFLVAEVVAMAGTVVSLILVTIALPRWGLEIVPWIVAGRALAVYLVQMGLADWPAVNFKTSLASAETWRAMRPLLLGASIYKTSPLVDRFLASQASVGGMTILSLAQTAMGALSILIEKSICMPVTPTLSRFVAEKDYLGLRTAYRAAVKRVTLVILILSAVFVVVYPIFILATVRMLKVTQDNAFDIWLLCLLLMGFAYVSASGTVIAAGFYALGDTSTPPKIGIATFPLGVLFKSIGFLAMGIEGLAIGITAIYFVMMIAMVFFLEKKINECIVKA